MRIVTFSRARNNLKSVLDRVTEDADCTVISRRDAQDVIVMPLNHYNGLIETLHLMGSAENVAHLRRSLDQMRSGQAVEHNLVDD